MSAVLWVMSNGVPIQIIRPDLIVPPSWTPPGLQRFDKMTNTRSYTKPGDMSSPAKFSGLKMFKYAYSLSLNNCFSIAEGSNAIVKPGFQASRPNRAPLAFHHFHNLQFLAGHDFTECISMFLVPSGLQPP